MTPASEQSRATLRWLAWAAAALLVLAGVELGRSPGSDPLHVPKIRAAERMADATRVLAAERIRRGIPIDAEADPNLTGLIGPEHTPITTTLGHLSAKRTSTNPNMAGLIVHLLGRAGVRPGECAAAAFSGSFPALNVAVLAALDAMSLRPVIVSSIGASTYGATHPDFTWPDMERVLFERDLFPWRSVAVAPGGVDPDSPLFGDEGLRQAQAAMVRSGLPVLDESEERGLAADIERRLRLYRAECGGAPAVFINVGGGATSIGHCRGADRLRPGLLPPGTRGAGADCGVLFRMAEAGVPAIHLLNVLGLARDNGLPADPVPLPEIPSGRVMSIGGYPRAAAWIGIAVLAGMAFWAGRRRR